jgi:hypothetical protein
MMRSCEPLEDPERTMCAWCQLNRPVQSVITRWNRWFCDQDCADAWERQTKTKGRKQT